MMRGVLRRTPWLAGAIGVLVFFALWQTASWFSGPQFLPGPVRVVGVLFEKLQTREYAETVLASYRRVMIGWASGSVIGVALGIVLGRYHAIGKFFYSPIQFFRVVPAVALVPILVIWLGVGESIKYVIIGYGVALVVAISISDAVQRAAPVRLQAARSMGAGPLRLFWGVLLPSVMPEILKGVRGALAFAFMSIVGIETLAAQEGVGQMIWSARVLHQTEIALLGVLTLGLMGIAADTVVRVLFRVFGYRFMLRG